MTSFLFDCCKLTSVRENILAMQGGSGKRSETELADGASYADKPSASCETVSQFENQLIDPHFQPEIEGQGG
jgi:hypothetical protein